MLINLAKSAEQGYPKSLTRVFNMFILIGNIKGAKHVATILAKHGNLKPLSILAEVIEKGADFYKNNSLSNLMVNDNP